jgi:exopolysaccharide biosynthesis WecB/TagA/CpsF family protein
LTIAELRITQSNTMRLNDCEIPSGMVGDEATEEVLHAVPTEKLQRTIGAVRFEVTDHRNAIAEVKAALLHRSCRVFAFCNMHTFNLSTRLPNLASALSRATVFNDGLGMDIASSILFGERFPANLNGTDFTPMLLDSLDRPLRVYLLGSQSEVVNEASRRLQERFPRVCIVGCHHGFFTHDESRSLVDNIRSSQTELLLVGMGNPLQELWAAEHASQTGAVALCVGALFDFLSGRIPRAPVWVRAIRFEWLYRLTMEPRRLWRRYCLGTGPFLYSVLKQKLARSVPASEPG